MFPPLTTPKLGRGSQPTLQRYLFSFKPHGFVCFPWPYHTSVPTKPIGCGAFINGEGSPVTGRLPCGLDLLHSLAGPQQAPLLYRASGLPRARMLVDSGGYGRRIFRLLREARRAALSLPLGYEQERLPSPKAGWAFKILVSCTCRLLSLLYPGLGLHQGRAL